MWKDHSGSKEESLTQSCQEMKNKNKEAPQEPLKPLSLYFQFFTPLLMWLRSNCVITIEPMVLPKHAHCTVSSGMCAHGSPIQSGWEGLWGLVLIVWVFLYGRENSKGRSNRWKHINNSLNNCPWICKSPSSFLPESVPLNHSEGEWSHLTPWRKRSPNHSRGVIPDWLPSTSPASWRPAPPEHKRHVSPSPPQLT